MRILQIIQKPQRRGAEIFACQLSLELKAKGIEVDIAYLFDHPTNELDFPLTFHPLSGNPRRRFTDFKAYRNLADLIEKGKYDLVQANAGDTLKYASMSKRIHGWKTPLVFRNANKMGDFIRNSWHRWLNNVFLSSCTHYISVSENCRQDLIRLFPPARNKSSTITIGTYSFNNVPEAKAGDRKPVVITIGGLVPEKNHRFLLEVFHAFLQEYPDATLWLFGDGKERENILQDMERLQLNDAVVLWGNRPDVISFLKSADVMVMPSKIEGLPGVILEAMMCQVPVVAAPVGGIPEVVIDGKTGFTPLRYDIDSYLAPLRILFSEKETRMKITHAANEMVKKEFLMPFIAEKFHHCYKQLVK